MTEYKDKYKIEEYTEEDAMLDEALKTVAAPSLFETAVKNNLVKNTVVNNYVTTKTSTRLVSSTDPRNMQEREDVKVTYAYMCVYTQAQVTKILSVKRKY